MPIPAETADNQPLKELPSVDLIVNEPELAEVRATIGGPGLAELARRAIGEMRSSILEAGVPPPFPLSRNELVREAVSLVKTLFSMEERSGVGYVINASGVIVHTNLGRAPLSDASKLAVSEAAGYSAVEYDLDTGKRGKRGARAESLICELTGAEAAIVVNNCASAAFLVLTALAKGREVVISRGELVEIGGDFRVPDVLERSGAVLREVGTTNRTKLADYEKAISEDTAVLMRVHPSNYRIIGFTAAPTIAELSALAVKYGVVFFEDAGSGALVDLSAVGLGDEPVIGCSISEGVDLISFSGDKLLGGPQSGIIAGKKELVEKVRRDPLFRALRADKLCYAALEATLLAFRRGTHFEEIPVLRMLSMSFDETEKRVAEFIDKLRAGIAPENDAAIEQIVSASAVGGGAAPGHQPATSVVGILKPEMSPDDLASKLRSMSPPVIARIEEGRLLLDLRTVAEEDLEILAERVIHAFTI